jgi:hypothetical protein
MLQLVLFKFVLKLIGFSGNKPRAGNVCRRLYLKFGARSSSVVKALCYKPEGREFDIR